MASVRAASAWVSARLGYERLGLATILLVALGLRLIWLHRIPTNITADEADNLQVIFRIEETGKPGFFGLDWKPAPAFSMYLSWAVMQLFGDTVFALRLASATLSTLALLPFYALARRVIAAPAALAAAALLATGRWYLHFSRSGWENVQTACYALLAAWALTVGLERRQYRWFVAAGAAAALGLYGYFAGRLILPALLAYAPLAWWWSRAPRSRVMLSGLSGRFVIKTRPLCSRGWERGVLTGFVIVTVTALILFYPQLRTIRENWTFFNQRARVVYVLDSPRPYLGETTAVGILYVQFKRTVDGYVLLNADLFNNGRDTPPGKAPNSGRYTPLGKSIYDPVTGLLFAAGLLLSLRRWRATALWWSLLWAPLLGTQVLSSGTPDAARAIVAAPFVYLFVGVSLDAAWRLVPPEDRRRATVALVLGLSLVAAVNVWSYFDWIQTEGAAIARRPAVEYADYDRWQTAVRCGLRGGAASRGTDGSWGCAHVPEG